MSGKKIGIVKDLDLSSLDNDVIAVYENSLKEFCFYGGLSLLISIYPIFSLSVPTYYVVAPAECSSNLSRFDGVKFGRRSENPKDLEELYIQTRSEGFGDEVKRRIMLGTFVLSAGYHDAYFTKAQKIRRIIKENIEEIFLSPLFKEKINKQLNIYKYLQLKKTTRMKDISLGGINNKNLKKLNMIQPFGFAGISYFE